jgi:hypothetical protein
MKLDLEIKTESTLWALDAKKDEYLLLKQALYCLRQSPCHWYIKIKTILNSLGLKANALDLCLFTGNIIDPSNPVAPPPQAPLTLGIYVDNFIYFSKDPKVERQFEQHLAELITV